VPYLILNTTRGINLMDTLKELKSRFNMEASEFNAIGDDVLKVVKKLQENNISFDGHYKLGFYSHMISMVKRLRSGEKVIEITEEVLAELNDYSIKAAEEVLEPLFTKYNTPVDQSEVLLVAIHIQASKNNGEGGEKDGEADSSSHR